MKIKIKKIGEQAKMKSTHTGGANASGAESAGVERHQGREQLREMDEWASRRQLKQMLICLAVRSCP